MGGKAPEAEGFGLYRYPVGAGGVVLGGYVFQLCREFKAFDIRLSDMRYYLGIGNIHWLAHLSCERLSMRITRGD